MCVARHLHRVPTGGWTFFPLNFFCLFFVVVHAAIRSSFYDHKQFIPHKTKKSSCLLIVFATQIEEWKVCPLPCHIIWSPLFDVVVIVVDCRFVLFCFCCLSPATICPQKLHFVFFSFLLLHQTKHDAHEFWSTNSKTSVRELREQRERERRIHSTFCIMN